VGFIFDMGNVLSLEVDVLPCMAEALGIPIAEITRYAGGDFARLLVGATTAEEFWEGFNRHFGTDVREDLLITCFHPVTDPRMERLILDLKAAGHRVVCGTNAFEKHYRYHLSRGEYAVFDRVYASNRMGIAKPSPAFFRRILEEEGWQARETFFIDDRADNVAAARDLGMRSFLYESPRSFPELQAWLADGDGNPWYRNRSHCISGV
jgi:HAD superfamily hydrolase (TIGR01509 family)